MPVTEAPDPPVVDFLRTASLSRLVAGPRLAELVSAATAGDARRAAAVADFLVKSGDLTRFQADKLLAGVWQGLVIGPYRLLCPLGRGGMGVVYLAKDDRAPHPGSLDAPRTALAALKVLPPARAKKEPRTLLRFQREMAIGRGLPDHPSLTRVLGSGDDGKVHFLAMEYVPGPTVRQLVCRSLLAGDRDHQSAGDGPITVGAACRIFADAAAGLHAAHEAGYVHRDVKPANVIDDPFGPAKVLDFGFAMKVGEKSPDDPAVLGGPGYTLGTMDYLAPEQAADATKVTRAADLYSLGCSLYFAVAGCPPFPGGTAKDKIRWHRTDAPPPLATFAPAVPAGFVRVVERLMAKTPRDRFPNAAAVAGELAKWAEPPPPRPVGGPPPDAELHRRAEAKWLARRSGPDAADDDGPIIFDDPPAETPGPPGVRPADTAPQPSLPTVLATRAAPVPVPRPAGADSDSGSAVLSTPGLVVTRGELWLAAGLVPVAAAVFFLVGFAAARLLVRGF